jgi:hypothetical protein
MENLRMSAPIPVEVLLKFASQRIGATARRVPMVAAIALFALFLPELTTAQVAVTTHHYDIGRTGQNTSETLLTPANVNSTTFGRLFTEPVDGLIYAQPLYMPGVAIPNQGTHNVVYVETENDSVYAFDADTGGAALWQVSFLINGATIVKDSVINATDVYPQVGITGTPVIDPSTNTMYVVSETYENSLCVHRLHALDITTGAEKFNGPVVIAASVPGNGEGSSNGTMAFNSLYENQRPGLLLLNGYVYIGFAANGDNGYWHGWILSYNAATLQLAGAFNSSPNGLGSGFWASGNGLAADTLNGGRLFVATGNGDYPVPGNVVPSPAPQPSTSVDYGDSMIQLSLNNGVMTPTDYFTPYNTASLDAADTDLGSGGVLVLPNQTGTYPHELLEAGKQGRIYVVNRDQYTNNNSHYCAGCSTDSEIVQTVNGIGGLWSMPAYWNGNIYFWGSGDNLKAYTFANGALSASPTSQSAESSQFPGSTPVVTANGTTNGIVWAVESDTYVTGPAVLRAYNALNVSQLLYASNLTNGRDSLGEAVKFAVPVVTNGKVYVGTRTELDVFGLFGSSPTAATPTFTPTPGSYAASQTVTLGDSTSGATIYYTTNGATPTTSSTKYTTGIPVTASTTISAIAVASGYLNSGVATGVYTIGAQAEPPVFTPGGGSYTSSQPVTITDASPTPTIYYTTNGTTPTHSSAVYSAAIPVSATTTITAIASSPGMIDSAPVSATYTISSGSGATINYSQGFANDAGLQLNGSADLDDSRLQLTNGGLNEASSAFYTTPIDIRNFTTDFTIQISDAIADGMTFTIQNSAQGASAIGLSGGNLGYGGGGTTGIQKSIAIKFDIYSNNGEGTDSTGLYQNGASPILPSINMTSSGVSLLSGDGIQAHIVYNGTTLTMTLTDAIVNKTFTQSWTVNLPAIVGGNTAYVGFTGGSGGKSSSQKVETWTLTSTPPSSPAAATPTITPGTESFAGNLSVSISDTTTGATIYYTTDGTTPSPGAGTTLAYGAPFTITGTSSVSAIATAPNFSTSAMATVMYTQSLAATPSIAPSTESFHGTVNVTVTDATTGASIYYTTDGSTPSPGVGTTKQYAGGFAVTSSATVNAMATAAGYAASGMTSATYTQQTVATPTISPAPGAYTNSVPVTITDATSGATIYYTTDGSSPIQGAGTTQAYPTGGFSLSASATVRAVAIAAGYITSAGASSTYAVQSSGGGISAYSSGFTSTTGLQLNGSASWLQSSNAIALTTNVNQAGSFFATTPVSVQSFTNTFSFQLPAPLSDGFVFVIQGNSTTGVGGTGGALGYSVNTSQTAPFAKSVAIKFDLYNNTGEGTDSTGLYINGAPPTVPSVDMTSSGLNLSSGHVMNATMTYDGTWLALTITDATTGQAFNDQFQVNIPSVLGGTMAYVGFTAGTGGEVSTQEILNWNFVSGAPTMQDATQFVAANLMSSSTSSGPSYQVVAWTQFVTGNGTCLYATKPGDNVTINVSVPTAGTYDVRFSTKKHNQRGIGQLSIDSVNVGSSMDQYSAADLWYETDLGNVTLTAGSHAIKLTVTGENAASTGYYLAIDTIKLLPE